MKSLSFVVLAVILLAAEGRLLSTYFHNDMVLQYNNARLFGWAIDKTGTPVEVKVSATIFNQVSGRATKLSATSNAKTGFWTISIPTYIPGAGESISDPHRILVAANSQTEPVTLSGVLFGNVFLCGGQSNMASIAVRHAENNKAELELAGNGVMLAPCGSHSYQHFSYLTETGQISVNGKCIAYRKEEAAVDTLNSIYLEDCVSGVEAAKAAGQYFKINSQTKNIIGDNGRCLSAYVEGWSWERCSYAEPNLEMTKCSDANYSRWFFNHETGHLASRANGLCLTGISGVDVKRDDPLRNIRIFRTEVDRSDTPINELRNIATQWTKPTITTLAKFSAVCWYMGRSIYDNQPTKDMPVGLVESAVSGTCIEAWSTEDALKQCPCHSTSGSGYNAPHVLWNAMIAPLQYSAFAGVAWYQAECNVHAYECYKCMFPAMISDWRLKFPPLTVKKDMPFVFVEITPRSMDKDFDAADLRMAQTAAFKLQYTGMAPTQDLGDAESPFNTEHPRLKKPVGHRLALHMRRFVYDQDIPDAFPKIDTTTLSANKRSVTITFDEDSFGGNFSLHINPSCPVAAGNCSQTPFEVMGSDNKWYPTTTSRIPYGKGFGVVVNTTSKFPQSDTIKKIRYLYAAWPVPIIISTPGLPLSPFVKDFTN